MVATRNRDYSVAVEGLDKLSDLTDIPEKANRRASQALNKTARKYRTAASRAIRDQVNLKAGYLDSSTGGHLKVTRFATPDSLESAITGRQRPTSLATFARGVKRHGRRAPVISVQKGKPGKKAERAFMINLRNGNIGLAVRLKPGERIENKRRMVQMSNGLYLLYGPSVDQVFQTVREDISGDAGEYMEAEFLRLMGLD